VDSIAESYKMALSVLAGEGGPARDIVLMNAAAGLLVAGQVGTLGEGMQSAGIAIDEGRARAALDRMVTYSQDMDK
jgi:anthranilate phosphoribosyltransferase